MQNKATLTADELNRRDFLRLAIISSVVIMGNNSVFGAVDTTPHAQLFELAPGVVQPEGWLREMLQKQAAHLGSKLPEISWPFIGSYWAGEEKDVSIKKGQSWFPWEQKAYWVDGAARLALVLGDIALMEQVWASINYTITYANSDGYMGPQLLKDPAGDAHRWPHSVFFRSLTACADARSPLVGATSKSIIEALQKHYLNDQASYGTPERNIANIESILWCCGHTKDARLLALAENAWRAYLTIASSPDRGDLSPERVFANTPINSHGVTYAETVKLPAILYLYTGKKAYLTYAQAAERRIFDHHMLIDGIPSTSEWYKTVTSLDLHETCDIADHTWSWGFQRMATGDTVWADRIERACFNAAPGAIKNDWKVLQYMSCPNQFLATLDSDHHPNGLGGFKMAFQPNPGKRVACCGGNVHRIFPNYVIRMWMQTANGGLAAVLYGASKVKANVGSKNDPIEIEQITNYPFEEHINFKIHAAHTLSFLLSLRIPAWCEKPLLKINGQSFTEKRAAKGFLVLNRSFEPGDLITLTLPMKTTVTNWPQGGIGLEHGPLVYSLAIKADWIPMVEEKYTTAEYPSWEATPASDWNFGLVLDRARSSKGIEFKRTSNHGSQEFDPWDNPPTTLTVQARKIDDWELQANPKNPTQKFTPPLPELSTSKISQRLEQLTLVPYGSTELRVTIFPAIKA